MELLEDYNGVTIRLTDERRLHILDHREMRDILGDIPAVLKRPLLVRQSQSDPTVKLYYRPILTALFGEKWLCVAVECV